MHCFLKNNNKSCLLHGDGSFWLLTLIITGLYITLSEITPLALDDYVFMGNWRDDCYNTSFSWSGWWRFYDFTRGYDNGRIANALCPIFTLYSPWKEIFPVVNGILVALIAVILLRFALPGGKSTLGLAVIWALMIIGLPWKDTIFVCDYSLNYIWSAAVTLGFLIALQKGNLTWGLILGILAAGWHESFAVATLCGLWMLILARNFRLSRRFYILTAIYLAVTLFFMLSPGMIGRIGDSVSLPVSGRLSRRSMFIVMVAVAVIVFLFFSKKGRSVLRKEAQSSVVIVSAGIMVSGFIIALFTVRTPRAFFWPDSAAIVLVVRLLSSFTGSLGLLHNSGILGARMWNIFATLAVSLLCILQTVSVIIWQCKYTRQDNEIIALVKKSETGTVRYNYTLPSTAPFYTLDIPVTTYKTWLNDVNLYCLKVYFNKPIKVESE